jgi:hypothetical protein
MPKNKTVRNSASNRKNTTRRRPRRSGCACKYAFTSEDYESDNGMMTSIWGPATWHFLHTISFNYPTKPSQEQKQQYRDFVLSLRNVLPCGKCRKNLAKNFQKLPLTMAAMESRDTFSRYMYNLHKTVNTMLGKTTPMTYEYVRDMYEHFRARCAGTSGLKHRSGGGGGSGTKKAGVSSEKGCVIPYYGKKQKCILQIVPFEKRCKTFRIHGKK